MPHPILVVVLCLVLAVLGCSPNGAGPARVTVSGSSSGAEADVLATQLARFRKLHPGIEVVVIPAPETADERHQLYVQWSNAGVGEPDVLQLDVVWLQEFAAAGWLLPADVALDDFFPAARAATLYQGRSYAVPWFVDVGMLYYRTDLVERPPATFDELYAQAAAAKERTGIDYGFVFQAARYEGLVTVFVEYLGGFGGTILGPDGSVEVDSEASIRALSSLYAAIHERKVAPTAVLSWQEEQTRFAFQNGRAVFMRNWPYAHALLARDPASQVAGRFDVAPMPAAPGGAPTATLGGQQLAISAHTRHPEHARALVRFLTAPEQMLERARMAGHLPARRSVYDHPEFEAAVGFEPGRIREIVEHATPRPLTPAYTELSQTLQLGVHRALTRQSTPRAALTDAAAEMRRILATLGLGPERAPPRSTRGSAAIVWIGLGVLAALGAALVWLRRGREVSMRLRSRRARAEARLGWLLLAPMLVVVFGLALFPLLRAAHDSLHLYDLRRPWLGRPFVGGLNYEAVLASDRFWGALGRTLGFVVVSVALELVLGLVLALGLHRSFRARGAVRTLALVPWAVPTVVAALTFRFAFEAQGPGAALATTLGLAERGQNWFSDERLAWVPIVLADVWKTTPFVALLLLAGLQTIPKELYEAAAVDGAGPLQRLRSVTLPGLRSVILVALVFRSLDAFRVFDSIYVLTQGGPGVATEPIALYTFSVLLQYLDFGRGAALSVLVFVVTFGMALLYVRLIGRGSEVSA
ncbi:MAG: extracellular solute-binding protein [Pseudomonadota bacterium]